MKGEWDAGSAGRQVSGPHTGKNGPVSNIVESCPLTKLNGGLSRLHSADEDAVS